MKDVSSQITLIRELQAQVANAFEKYETSKNMAEELIQKSVDGGIVNESRLEAINSKLKERNEAHEAFLELNEKSALAESELVAIMEECKANTLQFDVVNDGGIRTRWKFTIEDGFNRKRLLMDRHND